MVRPSKKFQLVLLAVLLQLLAHPARLRNIDAPVIVALTDEDRRLDLVRPADCRAFAVLLRELLREDRELGRGYALRAEGRVAGYLCLDFGGDPAYPGINGAWGTGEPYGTVHRMAFGAEFQGKGLFGPALERIEAACLARDVRGLRMDTDPSNRRMQHVLEKNGFTLRGRVLLQGDWKLAYDKALEPRPGES